MDLKSVTFEARLIEGNITGVNKGNRFTFVQFHARGLGTDQLRPYSFASERGEFDELPQLENIKGIHVTGEVQFWSGKPVLVARDVKTGAKF